MCKLAISFWLTLVVAVITVPHTRAQATPAADLHNLMKPQLTPVHCRRVYHCFWDTQDHRRYRRCHVCG